METRIRIGTSGYTDPDQGLFYPSDLSPEAWLGHYASKLPAVELGATSRGLPSVEEARRLPESFRICLTAPPRLTRSDTTLRGFLDAVHLLGKRAGPVLVQLSPGATGDVAALSRLLEPFRDVRIAVEPRRTEPLTDAFLRTLSARQAALVVTNGVTGLPRLEVTSTFVYLRLWKVADENEWEQWADRIALAAARGLEVYAFLRHGRNESAALRAQWLDAKVRQRLHRAAESAVL